MKSTIYTLSFLLILFSCKTSEEVNSDPTIKEKRYAIGQGGGFTGEYKEFILGEDGKVYKYDFRYDREVYYKTLSKADLIYFTEKLEALGLDGMEINQPGNMSKYIDVRIGKTSVNKVVWGSYNFKPEKELSDLHQELFENLSVFE